VNRESLGYWQLPKPHKGEEKEWHVVVRLVRQVPFGYRIHPDNDKLLEPIPEELEALELAKRHLKQYSYREVAIWLHKQTNRYISHMGLKKRVDIERKRKKTARIKRKLAQRLEETLQEIKKLEEDSIGAYRIITPAED
tara:strand:- start:1620 stop:2036 length:417 start_codon:yes stop_codon:yes gene_type:complete